MTDNRSYTSHPSCTICKVDYLGEGTCGACLFVANLLADVVIALNRPSDPVALHLKQATERSEVIRKRTEYLGK